MARRKRKGRPHQNVNSESDRVDGNTYNYNQRSDGTWDYAGPSGGRIRKRRRSAGRR